MAKTLRGTMRELMDGMDAILNNQQNKKTVMEDTKPFQKYPPKPGNPPALGKDPNDYTPKGERSSTAVQAITNSGKVIATTSDSEKDTIVIHTDEYEIRAEIYLVRNRKTGEIL